MNPLLKKLIRDYNYLNETLIDIKEISSIAEGEFRSALMETDPGAVEALRPKTQEINIEDDNVEVREEDTEVAYNDPKFKKLFRKLAVKCHPDKLGDLAEAEAKFLKRIYEDLTEANQSHDWGMLLKLAVELEVDIEDISDEELTNVKESIEKLQGQIKKYENSMAYSWYTKNDENSKKEYLVVCAKIFKKSLEDLED